MFCSGIRYAFTVTAVAATVAAFAETAAAQAKPASTGFGTGYTDIGPAVGFGNIGKASASYGARFERAVKPLPDYDGLLGIQASIDYYSYSTPFGGSRWNYKHMPIGVTANYHFNVDYPAIDLFLGVGLGYSVRSCGVTGTSAMNDCGYSSGVYGIGRVGGRYFFTSKVAAYVDAGAGGATINTGLMLKLR
jgi:hypothetical protein